MALFVRKTNTGSHTVPAYSIALQGTVVIVGLGNPGKKYAGTRHNIGFEAVDTFASQNEFSGWIAKKDMKCDMTQHTIGDKRVILIKPTTYMNLSGEAVRAVMQFYKVTPDNLAVVHDELDLPFGTIRTATGGSSAGHNGIKSIIEHCGDSFGRVRVGIKNDLRDKMDGADFVLGKFSKDEQAHQKALLNETSTILTEFIYGGKLPAETRKFIV